MKKREFSKISFKLWSNLFCGKLVCVRHSRVVLLSLRLLVAPAVPFHLWNLFSLEVHSGHGGHDHPERQQEEWETHKHKYSYFCNHPTTPRTVTDRQTIRHSLLPYCLHLLLPLVQCCPAPLEVPECPFYHVTQLCQEAQFHHHPLALPECTSLTHCACIHK